ACRELARVIAASRPARLLLVSPHSPRRPAAFGLWAGERASGSFSEFAAPRATIDLPADEPLRVRIRSEAGGAELVTWSIPPGELDHGALVPLWFLAEAGWSGPTTVASLPMEADSAELCAFGRALARAARALPGFTALVASG